MAEFTVQFQSYPADESATTCDGEIYSGGDGSGHSWANLRSGTNLTPSDSGGTLHTYLRSWSVEDEWSILYRSFACFDTSSIPDDAEITAVTLKIYGSVKAATVQWANFALVVVSADPDSSTTLIGADWSTVGSTALSNAISWDDWDIAGWNTFTFNASGLAHINKEGITHIAVIENAYDRTGNEPSWADDVLQQIGGYSAENANSPVLEVTYQYPAPPPGDGEGPVPGFGIGVEVALNQSLLTASPSWTDISYDVKSINIKRGRNHILDKLEAGTATIVLNNNSGDYYRDNSDSDYYPYFYTMTLIHVTTGYNDVEYNQFYGYIESITHGWTQQEGGFAAITVLQCVDIFKAFSKLKLLPLNAEFVGTHEACGGISGWAYADQKEIQLKSLADDADEGCDIARLHVGQSLTVGDDYNSEVNTIASIDENTYIITMTNNLANNYDEGDHSYIKKFPSVLSSIRVADICYELGWPSALMSLDTGKVTVAELQPPVEGTNAMEHLQAVAESESGLLFVDGGGTLTFQNRDARQLSPYNTSQATFTDDDPGSNWNQYTLPDLVDDETLLYNEVRISNTKVDLLEQGYVNLTAQANQAPRQLTMSNSYIANEADAFDKAYLLVKRLSYTQLRCQGLDINPEADPDIHYPKIFGYELSTRITLGLSTTAHPAGLSKEYHIEGITHDYNAESQLWLTRWQLWDTNQYRIFQAEHHGYAYKADPIYDNAHDAANGDAVYTESDETKFAIGQFYSTVPQNVIYRGFIQFDTSGLEDDADIESAQIIIQVKSLFTVDNEFIVTLVSGDDITHPMVVADYGDLLNDTTSLGTGTISTPKINVSFLVIELNASGIAEISKTGITKFGIRSSRDISDTGPGYNEYEYVEFDGVGSGFVPRLAIQLSEAT